jgi:predicted transcriptional regulator
MSETRSRVRECVDRNPGIHFNEISRQLGIATGQTQYHLRKLRRADRIEREAVAGRTHFYPPTYTDWERGAIALLRRETTREIVVHLLNAGRERPDRIADRLGIARSTVEWHLSNLVDNDIAVKQTVEEDEAGRVVVELTRPEETYRLLREVEPRLTDRLADRFARLTDDLLSD